MENKFFHVSKYYLICIDPVHIGTGGYRLGSVDNTIVREPHNKLPKIPGSSISGVVKSYYPYITGKQADYNCLISDGGCGKDECDICYTFGYSVKNDGKSQKGRAQFFDAKIVFFPIFTTVGTKWITTADILKQEKNIDVPQPPVDTAYSLKPINTSFVAVGWLSLKLENKKIDIQENDTNMKHVFDNLLVVNEDIFPFLVNTNLEVRTSTSIDPKTGTVKEGALFTYEAIPRGTVLSMDISFFEYSFNPNSQRKEKALKLLDDSIRLLSVLGLGGMNTRGFGRVKPIKR